MSKVPWPTTLAGISTSLRSNTPAPRRGTPSGRSPASSRRSIHPKSLASRRRFPRASPHLDLTPRRDPSALHVRNVLQTLLRSLQRLVHNRLRHRQVPPLLGAISPLLVPRLTVRLAPLGAAVRLPVGPAQLGVLPDVFYDAAQQRGEGGGLAGAEEREGVVLDVCGPVGGVGVEGV